MSVLEAVWVKSAAYASDPTEIDTKVFSKFAQIDGVLSRYKGTNVSKSDEHVWVISESMFPSIPPLSPSAPRFILMPILTVWENKAKHDAFVNGGAESVTGPFRSYTDAPPFFSSIPIDSSDYKKVLSAPVVSFGYATPKEGVTRESVAPLLDSLTAEQDKLPATHGSIRGPVNEKPGTFLSVMGWDSVEAHHETAKNDKIAPLLAEVKTHISELDVRDVKLVPFTL
jgi:hypothetical protein